MMKNQQESRFTQRREALVLSFVKTDSHAQEVLDFRFLIDLKEI
jgi:hypothetical protein